jgi:thymidylate synthase
VHAEAATLDDLMQKVFRALLRSKEKIRPSKGEAVEIRGALLRLSNPRARLSSTETKGTIFSCLGELLWYLGKRNDVESISYYLKRYAASAESDGTVHGAYGPRLFDTRGINQIDNILKNLARDDSRQAVIQLFGAEDIAHKYNDVPCTCTLQFFRRGGKLDLMTSMRSNDAFVGLPHDVFAFTMLQEIIARTVGLKLGTYLHSVGSLHLYEQTREGARQYLDEGYQERIEMPAMPYGDPWPSIGRLLELEEALRDGRSDMFPRLDPYWNDLGNLLRIFALTRMKEHVPTNELRQVVRLKKEMSAPIYSSYIRKRERRLESLEGDLLAHGGVDA